MTDQPTSCTTCKFFEPNAGAPSAVGQCHRYPPASHPRVIGDGEPTTFPQFPVVDADEWCGEHQLVAEVAAPDPGNVVAHEPWWPCKACPHGEAVHSGPGSACQGRTVDARDCTCTEFQPAATADVG